MAIPRGWDLSSKIITITILTTTINNIITTRNNHKDNNVLKYKIRRVMTKMIVNNSSLIANNNKMMNSTHNKITLSLIVISQHQIIKINIYWLINNYNSNNRNKSIWQRNNSIFISHIIIMTMDNYNYKNNQ